MTPLIISLLMALGWLNSPNDLNTLTPDEQGALMEIVITDGVVM